MGDSITLTYASVEHIEIGDDGHYHIHVPTFFEFGSFSNERIDYIFDTGAFITVLTIKAAKFLGFADKYTIRENVLLDGFTGSCLVDIKDIPGMVIGGRRLENVNVAVPHVDTDMNILGLNVIELFKYYIDTENDMIYFADNPTPSIEEQLRCGKVHILSPEMKSKLS